MFLTSLGRTPGKILMWHGVVFEKFTLLPIGSCMWIRPLFHDHKKSSNNDFNWENLVDRDFSIFSNLSSIWIHVSIYARAHVLTLECKSRCPIHLGPLPREIWNQAVRLMNLRGQRFLKRIFTMLHLIILCERSLKLVVIKLVVNSLSRASSRGQH